MAGAFDDLPERGQAVSAGGGAFDDLPAAVRAGGGINDFIGAVPRQAGLTARYALEGPAQALQIVSEPLRYFTDKLVPERAAGTPGEAAPPKSTPLVVQAAKLADMLGLPRPETANERVVGDASRLVAGSAGMVGASQKLAQALGSAPSMARTALQWMSANPTVQLSSAAGAGLAGGASREAGGSPLEQAAASMVGGLVGGVAGAGAERLGSAVRRAVTPQPQLTHEALDARLSATLQSQGVDWSSLSEGAKASLRRDAARALRTGTANLDDAMLARLADVRGAGMTPTRSMLTLDPVDVTREQNLAKIGASSSDSALQRLARIQGDNNRALIGRLNDLGAAPGTLPVDAGRTVTDSVLGHQAALRGAERTAWDAARASPGYQMPISPAPLNNIVRNLGQEGENVLGFLPKQITDYMQPFQTGQQPFTPQHYRNLQSMLANAARSADGNQAYAAGAASRMLRDADLSPLKQGAHIVSNGLPITSATASSMRAADSAPGEAINLVNQARAATRRAYEFEGSSPLVGAILSDGRNADPARIAQSYVIGGTADEAREVARHLSPQGMEVARQALMNDIKNKALSQASDEVGTVSQSALNRAIKAVGREKLSVFFSQDEIRQLESTARAASYSQVQPRGSAVNNSNSGTAVIGQAYDALRGVASRVPGVGPWFSGAVDLAVAQPIRSGLQGRAAAQLQDIAPLLQGGPPSVVKVPAGAPLLLPGIAATGGLLAAPQ